jgi:hypothetical protein
MAPKRTNVSGKRGKAYPCLLSHRACAKLSAPFVATRHNHALIDLRIAVTVMARCFGALLLFACLVAATFPAAAQDTRDTRIKEIYRLFHQG